MHKQQVNTKASTKEIKQIIDGLFKEATKDSTAAPNNKHKVFVSLTSAKNRTTTFCGVGNTLDTACLSAKNSAVKALGNAGIPVRIMVSIVTAEYIMTVEDYYKNLAMAEGALGYGVAFDDMYNVAFLDDELQSAGLIAFSGVEGYCFNETAVALYLKSHKNKKAPLNLSPQRHITLFETTDYVFGEETDTESDSVSKQIVYFGIKSEKHIKNNIRNWVKLTGEPVVFTVFENEIEKHPAKLLGKYKVMSINKAMELYPECMVWVTLPSFKKKSQDAVVKIVSPFKLHFLEADLVYRKGCKYLGNHYGYGQNGMKLCRGAGRAPSFKSTGTLAERMKQWEKYTQNMIEATNSGSPNTCESCPRLKYGFWRKSIKLSQFILLQSIVGTVCNFKCSYCFSRGTLEKYKTIKDGYNAYDALLELSNMPELNKPDFELRLANGEFLANKLCNEMIDVILRTKWSVSLVSNMSIYREKFADLLETGRVKNILTSLDSGTPETFKKIKRNDMFNKVIQNLKRYPVNKTKLTLKYVFLEGINDNEADIDGFLDVAKEVGASIMLSSNLTLPFTEKIKELITRLVKNAKPAGVTVSAEGNYVRPDDAKFVREC